MKTQIFFLVLLVISAVIFQGCLCDTSKPSTPQLTNEQAKAAAVALLKNYTPRFSFGGEGGSPPRIVRWHGLLKTSEFSYMSATDVEQLGVPLHGGFQYMLTWDNKWVIRKIEFSDETNNPWWSQLVYFPVDDSEKSDQR